MEATNVELKTETPTPTEKQEQREQVINHALESIIEAIEKLKTKEIREFLIKGELRTLYSFGNLHGYCEGLTAGATLHKLDTEAREIKQAEEALGIV